MGGKGQLEGVENQPFPPPEGAPEDSSGNWQTAPRHLPHGFGQNPTGKCQKNVNSLEGMVEGLRGEKKQKNNQVSQTRKARKQVENDQSGFP